MGVTSCLTLLDVRGGHACSSLTFWGKGVEVIDELSLLESQGMKSHSGLPYSGEERMTACCVSLVWGAGVSGEGTPS